ncbi:hypothetical protein Tco_1457958 [Tanacetum coccineum]
MDEGFTTSAYPDVQENLKLTVDEQVIPEEPVSSTGTLSSLQHLAKDFSFGDQFLNDKPSEADNEKTTADTEAESMVSVTIQQDISVIPPMTSPVIDLVSRPDSPNVHWPLPTTTTTTTAPTTTTTTLPLPPQPQQGPTDPILIKRIGELDGEIQSRLCGENQSLENDTVEFIDSQEIELKVLNDSVKGGSGGNRRKVSKILTKPPPGYPPSPHTLLLHHRSGASRASGLTGTRFCPSSLLYHLGPNPLIRWSYDRQPEFLMIFYMDDKPTTDEQQVSSDEEVGRDHIPTWKGLTFESVKVFHHDMDSSPIPNGECPQTFTDQVDDAILRYNVSKPLPLGGKPGHVTIQPDFFFNKDLEYLRYGRKVGRPALSISKMKAAYYPDVGLEQLVPDQFWIAEECKYDIAAMYGISHWWFQRQRFYIDRFSSEGDRRAVRTHMRILSVIRIEVFSMYGYNYMKKIVLRRADLKEYVIAERDFKHMYPSDFEDLYLLNLQGHLNHLSPKDKKILTTAVNLWTRNLVIRHRVEDFQLGIESYQTQLNLTKPRWEATGFEFKHDYTVIDSPRAVTFRDRYGVQMIMRFNEIHKFSDGTLQQIDGSVWTISSRHSRSTD